jgi:hypothetical protein
MTNEDRSSASERTRVRRLPNRGVYDRKTIDRIIDEALIGHVGFVADGYPYVIPMVVVRNNDDLLLHGSTASRLTRHLAGGADVCVSIVHHDGIVVARSVFDNSMNYRSAIIFGRAEPIGPPLKSSRGYGSSSSISCPGAGMRRGGPATRSCARRRSCDCL